MIVSFNQEVHSFCLNRRVGKSQMFKKYSNLCRDQYITHYESHANLPEPPTIDRSNNSFRHWSNCSRLLWAALVNAILYQSRATIAFDWQFPEDEEGGTFCKSVHSASTTQCAVVKLRFVPITFPWRIFLRIHRLLLLNSNVYQSRPSLSLCESMLGVARLIIIQVRNTHRATLFPRVSSNFISWRSSVSDEKGFQSGLPYLRNLL